MCCQKGAAVVVNYEQCQPPTPVPLKYRRNICGPARIHGRGKTLVFVCSVDFEPRKVHWGWGGTSEVLIHSINKTKTWGQFWNATSPLIEVFCSLIQAQVHMKGFPFIVSSTFVGRIPEQLRFVFGNVFGVQVVHSGECGLWWLSVLWGQKVPSII